MSADPLAGLHLPAAFEPTYLDHCDSAIAEGARRASAGAPEGTLVWVGDATDARGRLGARWRSSEGALHCALVLRPGLAAAELGELLLVTTVALGAALAELVVPLTELRYRWPNAVLLSDGRAGGAWLAAADDWVVLAASANVATAPPTDDFHRACVRFDGGNPAATTGGAFAAFARQLVAWLGRWDDEGLAPVLRHFTQRMDQPDQAVRICLPGGASTTGRIAGLGDDGAMLLEQDGRRTALGINAYMGLPGASSAAART